MERFESNQEFSKGALAGLAAGAVMFVFVELFHWLGLTHYGISYLAGDTVFTYRNNLLMNLIAFGIHCGAGMWWGIVLAFLFTKAFSSQKYRLKILFCCFCIFFFHLGFLDEFFHYDREIHRQTLDLVIILLGYQVYGLVLSYGLRKLKLIDPAGFA